MAQQKTTTEDGATHLPSSISKAGGKTYFDKIDGPVKIINGLAIIIGIIVTLAQYMSNSRHQREEAAKDYQKTFF